MAALSIKQCACLDLGVQHLFKTKGLGTKLNLIAMVLFGLAAFIFDGKYGAIIVEFHDIGLTRQSETLGADREGPH